MLSVRVGPYGANGNQIRDDGEWLRRVSTSLYFFAELLVAKGLAPGRRGIVRTPDLVIRWSELSGVGQDFVKTAFDRWLKSIDDVRTTEATMIQKLERRRQKFSQQHSLP